MLLLASLEVEQQSWSPKGPVVYIVKDTTGNLTRDEAVKILRAAADDLESR